MPEQTLDDNPRSFNEEITELENQITLNLNTIKNFVESIQSSSPESYAVMLKEYEDINNTFVNTIGEARTIGEDSDETTKNSYISNLGVVLNYTKMSIERYSMPSHNEEAPSEASNPATAMVVAEQPLSQGQIVEMQNVGPLRAWWDGLSPATRTVAKAAIIGAAIFGAKWLYDFTKKKMGETPTARTSNPRKKTKPRSKARKVVEDYEDEDDED